MDIVRVHCRYAILYLITTINIRALSIGYRVVLEGHFCQVLGQCRVSPSSLVLHHVNKDPHGGSRVAISFTVPTAKPLLQQHK